MSYLESDRHNGPRLSNVPLIPYIVFEFLPSFLPSSGGNAMTAGKHLLNSLKPFFAQHSANPTGPHTVSMR